MKPEYIAAWILTCGIAFLLGSLWSIWRMAKDDKRWGDKK